MLGAGGVGKTTTSILVAIEAAKLGKRVGLISVDPAKRLADALGIPLSAELMQVQLPVAWTQNGGSISAAMIDQKATLDSLIFQFTSSSMAREKIFKNSLYKSAADKIGGALEYMAIAKLGQLVDDPSFDLIVVDTPPDLHALDFLIRPNFLARFVENRVMRWLIKPIYYASRMNVRFLRSDLIDKVIQITGLDLLREIADFFVNMQDTIAGLYQTSARAQQVIAGPETSIFFVAAPSERVLRSFHFVESQLASLELKLRAVVVNRCLPQSVKDYLDHIKSDEDLHSSKFDILTNLYRRSKGEIDFLKEIQKAQSPHIVKALTELTQNPHNWEGLGTLASQLSSP